MGSVSSFFQSQIEIEWYSVMYKLCILSTSLSLTGCTTLPPLGQASYTLPIIYIHG